MIRKILTVCLLFITALFQTVYAQDGGGGRWQKIKAIKIGFINDRLNMSSEQSAKFWPVYDRYEQDRWELRKDFREKYKKTNPSASPAQARDYIEDNLDYQEQELELKRKYKNQLMQVISAQQLAQLYEAERDFKKMLLQQLRDNR